MYSFNENKNEEEETDQEQSFAMSLNEASQDILSIVVRICGLILLFIGMWIAIQVFNEAISLYRDPGNIERMAKAIEDGSNIDKSIAPIRDSILSEDGEEVEQKQDSSQDGFRLSYFVAWVVEILLLLLLARIAVMAVKTGGELALYDAQVKRLARQIVNARKND